MAKVLIIDDEPSIRALLRTILTGSGHRVTEAASGPEGLQFATSVTPDVIVLDVMLPGMDGIEVFERLRKADATKGIPVIVVTASEHGEDTLRIQVGVSNIFRKPFEPEVLVARIEEIVGGA